MRRIKSLIESLAVVATAGALSITAFASPVVNMNTTEVAKVETGFDTNGIAGVALALNSVELAAYSEVGDVVTVEQLEVETVAAAVEEEVTLTPEEQEWQDKLMTNVTDSLNVRDAANAEANVVGKLRSGDLATIVEAGDEWTHITSGNVDGYVKNEYCMFGTDALNYAKENCQTVATATTDCLNVRSEMNTEATVVDQLANGETITVDTEAETQDGWVAVLYNGNTCYVSAEFVTVALSTTTGVTLEEEAAALAALAAQKAAEQRAATIAYGQSLAASVDDVTLLACLIQCECSGYDAQLAVGAVVCNRVKSGSYPSTIYDVIYQSGQFGPATNGALANALVNGPTSSSLQAAQAALSGQDNTGGLLHFNAASSGHYGNVIGSMVFY